MADKVIISTGLKFKSTTFSDTAEIVSVAKDSIDIRLTSSQGHARIMKGWSLSHTKDCFDRGVYVRIEKEVNYSVW